MALGARPHVLRMAGPNLYCPIPDAHDDNLKREDPAHARVHHRRHPQCGPGRARWRRQDDPGRGVAGVRRRHRCAGQRDERQLGVRFRSSGEGAPALAVHGGRELRSRLAAREPRRYARISRLSGPGDACSRGGGDRGGRGGCAAGRPDGHQAHDGGGGAARPRAHGGGEQDRRGGARSGGAPREPRGGVRHRMHAHQPARRRRRERGGLFLRAGRRACRLLVGGRGAYPHRRSGRRGRRGADGALPGAGRGAGSRQASRCVRASAARRPPHSGVLHVGRKGHRYPGAREGDREGHAEPPGGEPSAVSRRRGRADRDCARARRPRACPCLQGLGRRLRGQARSVPDSPGDGDEGLPAPCRGRAQAGQGRSSVRAAREGPHRDRCGCARRHLRGGEDRRS